jgi:transcriptional regulator with XRE-family HTH domain
MNARAEHALTHRIAFAERLRMLLVQKGHALVPAQLAAGMKCQSLLKTWTVTAQTFSNWLNGVQIPSYGNLQALAEFLSVTPEYLLEGTPVLHFAPAKHNDVETQQLVEHFQQLDAYGRRCALAMVAGLVRLKGGAV